MKSIADLVGAVRKASEQNETTAGDLGPVFYPGRANPCGGAVEYREDGTRGRGQCDRRASGTTALCETCRVVERESLERYRASRARASAEGKPSERNKFT